MGRSKNTVQKFGVTQMFLNSLLYFTKATDIWSKLQVKTGILWDIHKLKELFSILIYDKTWFIHVMVKLSIQYPP